MLNKQKIPTNSEIKLINYKKLLDETYTQKLLKKQKNYIKLKRIFDLITATLIIIIISPILLTIALIILIKEKQNPIFKQIRIGKNNKQFKIYKYRTMQTKTKKYEKSPTINNPKITKTGKFLRKTGLDELPQLINVLKGEMSPKEKHIHEQIWFDLYYIKNRTFKLDIEIIKQTIKLTISGNKQ